MRALRCSAAPSIWTTWSPNLSSPTPQRPASGLMALAARRSLSRLTHLDFALLSIYWIAIGYLWTSLGGLILPDLVVHLVRNAPHGPALGVLEGVGLLVAAVRAAL